MAHQILTKGANAPLLPQSSLDENRVHAVVRWSESEGVDIDVAALLLSHDGRTRTDDDFVFYNAPVSVDGAVRLLGKRATDDCAEDRVVVDLASLPDEVPRVLIAASLDAGTGTGFGDVDDLSVEIRDADGAPQMRFDVTDVGAETAVVLGELYLRGDEWKFRAVGQGWDSGLAGLATEFGIAVDESEVGESTITGPSAPEGDAELVDAESGPGSADEDEPALAESAPADESDADLVEVTGDGGDDADDDVPPLPGVDASDLTDGDADAAGSIVGGPAPMSGTRRSRSGVKTRKKRRVPAPTPSPLLAGDPSWQPARLFSVVGVGTADEKERRATSALLSTMMAVREFGRALVTRFGGPAGSVEAFIEVPFKLEDRSVIPDGVLRVARAGRVWTALLEVKTGDAALRNDQVERYLDLARQQGYDAVVTLSNDLAPVGDRHPLSVDGRKLRRVGLHHISWSEVLHEAQMQLSHRGIGDRLQAWVLAELVRYLRHPSSGAVGFDDMGAAWVPVREAVAANTLRPADAKVGAVVDSWEKLIKHLSLTMTSTLGVAVAPVQPRRLARDHGARAQNAAAELAKAGTLSAVLRVPGAAAPISIAADLRTSQVRTSILVDAPREGGGQRRVNWILRQLGEAPDDLVVEVLFTRRGQTACELLRDVRGEPGVLLPDSAAEVRAFRLTASTTMGPKRNGLKKAFIPSVNDAVEAFYARVLQGLKPSPPALPSDVAADAIIAVETVPPSTQA